MDKACLPGRETPLAIQPNHYVSGVDFTGNYPAGMEAAQFAMGCLRRIGGLGMFSAK